MSDVVGLCILGLVLGGCLCVAIYVDYLDTKMRAELVSGTARGIARFVREMVDAELKYRKEVAELKRKLLGG